MTQKLKRRLFVTLLMTSLCVAEPIEKRQIPSRPQSSFDFSEADSDGNGCIEGPEELQKFRLHVGKILGQALKMGDVEKALRAGRIAHSADVNKDGRICQCDLLTILLLETDSPGKHRHAFRVYEHGSIFDSADTNRDGELTEGEEMDGMVHKLAQCVPVARATALVDAISRLEKDDGKMSRSEYMLFLHSSNGIDSPHPSAPEPPSPVNHKTPEPSEQKGGNPQPPRLQVVPITNGEQHIPEKESDLLGQFNSPIKKPTLLKPESPLPQTQGIPNHEGQGIPNEVPQGIPKIELPQNEVVQEIPKQLPRNPMPQGIPKMELPQNEVAQGIPKQLPRNPMAQGIPKIELSQKQVAQGISKQLPQKSQNERGTPAQSLEEALQSPTSQPASFSNLLADGKFRLMNDVPGQRLKLEQFSPHVLASLLAKRLEDPRRSASVPIQHQNPESPKDLGALPQAGKSGENVVPGNVLAKSAQKQMEKELGED